MASTLSLIGSLWEQSNVFKLHEALSAVMPRLKVLDCPTTAWDYMQETGIWKDNRIERDVDSEWPQKIWLDEESKL